MTFLKKAVPQHIYKRIDIDGFVTSSAQMSSRSFAIFCNTFIPSTVWKVSKCGVFSGPYFFFLFGHFSRGGCICWGSFHSCQYYYDNCQPNIFLKKAVWFNRYKNTGVKIGILMNMKNVFLLAYWLISVSFMIMFSGFVLHEKFLSNFLSYFSR